MNYDQAIKIWGKHRIEEYENDPRVINYYKREKAIIDVSTVSVDFNFNAGYNCCGGTDPSCYCSFAESPSAEVMIQARDENFNQYYRAISFDEFDFATVLEQILEEK